MMISFANNNLNGHTSFKDGYIPSRSQISGILNPNN